MVSCPICEKKLEFQELDTPDKKKGEEISPYSDRKFWCDDCKLDVIIRVWIWDN